MSMTIVSDRIASPIGPIQVYCLGDRVVATAFDAPSHSAIPHLSRHFAEPTVRGAAPAALRRAFDAYFDGDLSALNAIETEPRGTEFQRSVWAALRAVPAGATESYAGLAAQIGRPKAVRAVGMANRSNPIALIHPCHRVIGSSGALTGFAGGLDAKAWLLAHEGANFLAPALRPARVSV